MWLLLLLLAATCVPGPQAHWGYGFWLRVPLMQSLCFQPAGLNAVLARGTGQRCIIWACRLGAGGRAYWCHFSPAGGVPVVTLSDNHILQALLLG